MDVVLDTNVWISGLLWGGPPGTIIQLAERGQLTVFATVQMLDEIQEVLARPEFEQRRQELEMEITDIIAYAAGLITLIAVPHVPLVVRDDPDDDVIVACAVAVQAQYIISGDRHLRVLQQVAGIPIVTPSAFLRLAFPSSEAG